MTWRMHTACCTPKATNTHSEYVILIAFFLTALMVTQTRLNVTVQAHFPFRFPKHEADVSLLLEHDAGSLGIFFSRHFKGTFRPLKTRPLRTSKTIIILSVIN